VNRLIICVSAVQISKLFTFGLITISSPQITPDHSNWHAWALFSTKELRNFLPEAYNLVPAWIVWVTPLMAEKHLNPWKDCALHRRCIHSRSLLCSTVWKEWPQREPQNVLDQNLGLGYCCILAYTGPECIEKPNILYQWTYRMYVTIACLVTIFHFWFP